MQLYYAPISSYSQKALMAFYEKGVAFTPEIVNVFDPAARLAYKKINPLGKVPTLVLDDGHVIPESTIIIEYLEDHFPESGTKLIPRDKDKARQTRFHDRNFDLYINDSMSTIFFDGRKPEADRNAAAVRDAKATLDTVYRVYDELLASRTWVMGDDFTMADCAAAPALVYARMVYPFEQHKHLSAYTGRLLERPSLARVLRDAAPYLARLSM